MHPSPHSVGGPEAGPPAPALRRIGQIAITVRDLDRAVAFYRDVLGLPLLFQAPPGLAFFDCGGVRLMLSRPELPGQDQPAAIVYYVVDDLPATWATLRSRGAQPATADAGAAEPHPIARMPDHDLWMAFLADGEGNTIGLMSEVRPPAPR